jgi:hypothetical protein
MPLFCTPNLLCAGVLDTRIGTLDPMSAPTSATPRAPNFRSSCGSSLGAKNSSRFIVSRLTPACGIADTYADGYGHADAYTHSYSHADNTQGKSVRSCRGRVLCHRTSESLAKIYAEEVALLPIDREG